MSQNTSNTPLAPSASDGKPNPTSSSPWDEDLPEEEKKPQAVGTLAKNPAQSTAAPLKVPKNLEEKVGVKIPAAEIINTANKTNPSLPAANANIPAQNPPPAPPAPAIVAPAVSQEPQNPTPAMETTPPIMIPKATPPNPPSVNNQASSVESKKEKPGIIAKMKAAKEGMPAASTGSLFSKVWIVIIGLVLIFTACVFLTEAGMISLGLEKVYSKTGIEKLWGGLPSDAEGALIRSFAALQKSSQYKIKGQINYKVDSKMHSAMADYLSSVAGGSAQPEVSEAASTGSSSNEVASTLTEATDYSATISAKAGENESLTEIIFDSGTITLYNKGSDLLVKDSVKKLSAESKWSDFKISDLENKKAQTEIFKIGVSEGFSAQGIWMANEKVGNVRCYRYRIDSMEIGNSLSEIGITSDMIQSISGDIWIGVKDKMIKKLKFAIMTPSASFIRSINLDLSLYDFGAKNNFETISEDNIIAGSLKAETENISNDAARKEAVASILAVLEQYKTDNGVYPLAADLIKLNTSGNAVEKALVPEYLDALPFDPKASEGWYYAYKSNGIRCSVSARLEDQSDTEGTLVNNTLLYLKYNSD